MTRMDRVGISGPIRLGRPLPLRLSVSLAAVRRSAAMAAVLISLSACWGLSGESRSPGGEQVLQSNLSVASAALAAGQPAIAQKLYLALAERFDDAPEPVLGLGYIALQTESPGEAGEYFRRAAKLAVDAPGLRAEALLGAARASLAQGDSGTARHHLSAARDLAEASSTIAWIENGLAVAAVFEEDYRTAEAHYASALRQPAAHPRIAANFVRMLVASERIDEAERTYGAYAASYWEEGDRQTLQSLIDGARRLPPLPDRPDPRLLLRLTGPEALPELATEAAYPAEDGLRSGLEGLVLTIGDRRFPPAPVTTATSPAAAAPAIQLPFEPRPGETVESVPATSGSIPEGLLAVRDVRSTRTTIPAIATALPGDFPSSSAPSSGSSSRSDVLVLRTDPAQATLERAPDVDAPAVGSRWATSTDERLRRDAGADVGPVESAVPGMGRLHSGLMLVAPSSHSPDSSDLHAPASGTATDWPGTDSPGTDPKLHESGTDLASGLSSITAGNEEWEHRFGPGPAQSANALLLTVSSDDAPSPPDDGSLWAPSSSDTAAYDSAADGATPEGAREVASAPASGSRSATVEDEDGVLQSEPSPMLVVNVAILNDYSNYDPFSAATASYRPFRLGSAVPQSDYALWDPVWMPQGGGSDPRTLVLAAAQGHDDWLPQVADAAPPEPEPGDEWTVLLGTGQRLTLGVDAAAVAIASPEVADVQLLTPRVLFVMGRSLGRTTVSVLGEDGSVFEQDVSVVLDLKPLRALLAGEPGLESVQVEGLARGVALAGDVGSQEEAKRALGLVTASLPEGVLIENNLDVGVDLEPLQALLASEPGLGDVGVRQVGRGVALTGEVASAEAADRAHGLAVASLPEGLPVENNLRVAFDIEPLRMVLAAEPGLEGIQVRRLARGVALAGNVDSPEAADRALGLATASLPEGTLIESNLDIGLDLGPLRALLAGEPGLGGVEVRRVGRGFALTGEVAWAEAADRAHRLAVASLPEAALVENNLRVAFDILPLRAALAGEPGMSRVQVQELARGVALIGEVDSPEMAERALRLATASLPEGLLVENNLSLRLDLAPLDALIAGEPGLQSVEVYRDGRGVALAGEVASVEAAERAHRLAEASLPEGTPVENNLRVSFDIAPLRTALAGEPGLDRVRVKRFPRGVSLIGDVASAEAVERARRLAQASIPEGISVDLELSVGLDLGPLRSLIAEDSGLVDVEVQWLGRGVALTGEVASMGASDRAHRLAVASLPEDTPVENGLRVAFDAEPIRALLADEPEFDRVQVQRLARSVALTGEVDSPEAADRATRLASAALPEGILVESQLDVEPDLKPLRALLAGEPGLHGVALERLGRGVALTGEVASAEASERAHGLAVTSLPESLPVQNNLRTVIDTVPLLEVLTGEPGLERVQVKRLARGVALTGYVDSPAAADRALGLASASLPEGLLVENNLTVGLGLEPLRALVPGESGPDDLSPLRVFIAGEPGLEGVRVQRIGRGMALTGEVASAEAADRAHRLVVAALPETVLVENNLRVSFDMEPLRAVLAAEQELAGIRVRRLPRGVELSGNVDSQESADRALRLAAGSLPEGTLVENNLDVGLDLGPLRALLAGEPGLADVEIRRVGRGVVLTGEVASAEAAGRAHGLAAASLPESLPVENNLRVEFDIVPLRVLLAGEAGLERVQVRRLARGVALAGYVDSPDAADRAMGLASASLPEGLPVENNLTVGLGLEPLRAFLAGEAGLDDLSPLRAFIAGEPGLDGVEVLRVGRGVALTGEVASAEAADRAHRLAVAALPEGVPVENNLRVVFDIVPLRVLLAGEAGLARVQVQRLARGVALAGYVDSAAAEDRALRLAAASLPEGLVVENNLDVGLDLKPLRALLAGEPGLAGVEVRRVGRGVALTGAVASAEAADRAYRLAAASLPDSLPVENNLRVVFDVEPLRAVLAAEPGLEGVGVRQLARGVALAGEVASPEAADRAYRLAAASLPEGLVVENNLEVGLDLEPLRALMSGEAGLEGVEVLRVGRGVALTGEVASADAADRAHRLAVAFLPESLPVENNLRVQFDIEPLRTVLGAEPGLEGIRVQRLARGVALAGDIASPEAAERARRLAVASLPEGLLVENNLSVVLDLAPLHALMVGEPGLEDVEVRRVGQGVALTGEVDSAEASDRAHRLAMASLPESLPVENNLRVVFDVGPLRAILAGEPELDRVQVQELGRGVVLTGEVASAEAFERAQRIATASLPEGVPVENSLRLVPDIEHLRAALAGEPGLDRVQVQRLARGVALSGDVDSPAAEDRALGLAAASLAEGVPVENNLNVGLDLAPLRSLVAGEPGLKDVRVERTGRGVALIGEVGSAEVADQAARLAAALLPEDMAVENNLRVVWDAEPLRALLAGSPELDRVQVQRLARSVVLSGEVASHAAADLVFRLASASVPEGVPVENTLDVRLDLAPLRVLIAGERDLRNVRVKRVGRGVALSGEVGSAEASDRAHRLAVASLPEGVAVENGLRVAPDVGPLRVLLAGEPGLERVHVQKLARGVALAGDVASPKAADRALRLAAASLPEGMLVEDNLSVALDLAPLEALMAAEEDFEGIRLNRIGRGVALTGEVGSQTEAERAARLAAATLPESALVENNLRVVLDSGPLRAALAGDPEFDRVHVLDLEHGLSLNGEVSSAVAAARAHRLAAVSLPADTPVENNLRIAGPLQVNLEVQIAEVQRSIAEEFGFNWELFGRSAEGVLGGGFRIGRQLPPPLDDAGRPFIGRPGTIPTNVVDGLTSPSLILSRTWEEIGITGMVDALAKAGLANVLARPNVTANSGETASFFSGGEFPLPSGFKDGVIVFEYKKYGVVLDFVPTIVDDGRVELTVRPEVSEPSQDNSVQVAGGVTVPVINVRRAETTVEMGDGESIVIAGLFSSASNEVQSGVPVLKDLPLLGAMFGHTSTRADELELIVTVTARLVQAGPAPGEAVTAGSGQANNSYYY